MEPSILPARLRPDVQMALSLLWLCAIIAFAIYVYAIAHRDIVAKFGRFPHRNRLLGRETTPAEQEFLDGGGFAG